jgi:hypothetical protein
MSAFPPDLAEHDPELSRFLEAVVDLSARRHNRGPDEFLALLEGLGETFRGLRKYRTDKTLTHSFDAFARKRVDLVDEPSEYPLAWDEVMVLALALGDSVSLVFPALKHTIDLMSSRLSEEGVPALFGQMLKRTRQLARQHADAELGAWVNGVIDALPGDDPPAVEREVNAWAQGLVDARPGGESPAAETEVSAWVQGLVDALPGDDPPADEERS